MVIVGLFFALLMPVVLSSAPAERTWGALFALLLWLCLPLLAGPALGVWVRSQAWPTAREGAALAAAVLGVTAASMLFDHLAAEPIKQFIAERTGAVDPKGKRQKVVMSIGINVSTPEDAASAAMRPSGEPDSDPVSSAVNLGTKAMVTFLLAGGLALRGWRRERDGPRRRPSGARQSCACRCWRPRSSRISSSTRWPACAARSPPTRRAPAT
jgi:hypothetical protein